eukprot:1762052-Rhodomonas_salina.1
MINWEQVYHVDSNAPTLNTTCSMTSTPAKDNMRQGYQGIRSHLPPAPLRDILISAPGRKRMHAGRRPGATRDSEPARRRATGKTVT